MAINESGDKMYELSNHLGNVLNVVADRKLPVQLGSTGTVDYYVSNVMSYSDYYPFGMQVPNKHGNVSDFRYGFNGMESDDEIKSVEGGSYDFGARMYDPRVGRFFARDPREHQFTSQSTYVFAGNNPILLIDKNGENPEKPSKEKILNGAGGTKVVLPESTKILGKFVDVDGNGRFCELQVQNA